MNAVQIAVCAAWGVGIAVAVAGIVLKREDERRCRFANQTDLPEEQS